VDAWGMGVFLIISDLSNHVLVLLPIPKKKKSIHETTEKL
jgi:hypothetical protein